MREELGVNFISIFIVFLSLGFFCSCNNTENAYEEEIKKADSLFNNQSYKEAKEYYNK